MGRAAGLTGGFRVHAFEVDRRAVLRSLAAAGAGLAGWSVAQTGFAVPPPPPAWPAQASARPAAGPEGARVWRVGPQAPLQTVAEAARLAGDGDVVEIEAGDYRADVAVWLQKRLTIRGVGGQARLHAEGRSAEGKAIWVLRDGHFEVSNVDFVGVRVPHRNGAGIRFEGGRLVLRSCLFWGSESGILTSGGGPRRLAALEVEGCEFGYLGDGEGQAHGIYAGDIGLLRVTGSYFHHGNVGHLIKSRAAVNDIRANRITDEADGRASYEIDLPNGGLAVVVGNVIQQGPHTENWSLVTFGQEGYRQGANRLFVASNTLVNDRRAGGLFVRVVPGADEVALLNNLRCGPGRYEVPAAALRVNDVVVDRTVFNAPDAHDYRLRPGRTWRYEPPSPREVEGLSLVPQAEYLHPRRTQVLRAAPNRPGAMAYDAPGT